MMALSARLGWVLLLVVGWAGCATPPSKVAFAPTATETRLVELMAQRLEIARKVAWIKFQNHTPVRDKAREAELLNALANQGKAFHLPVEAVETFFAAQIDASCQVQSELIRLWDRGATLPVQAPMDLRRDIRPQLDRLSAEMLKELAALGSPRPGLAVYAKDVIRSRGFSWRVAQMAVAPLR